MADKDRVECFKRLFSHIDVDDIVSDTRSVIRKIPDMRFERRDGEALKLILNLDSACFSRALLADDDAAGANQAVQLSRGSILDGAFLFGLVADARCAYHGTDQSGFLAECGNLAGNPVNNTNTMSGQNTAPRYSLANLGGFGYSLDNSNNTATLVSVSYNPTDVVIPSTISANNATYAVVGMNSQLFANNTVIRSVTIPASIDTVPSRCFFGCTGLETVVLNYGLRYIEDSAFEGCTSLTNVGFPGSLYAIRTRAFLGCKNLKGRPLPGAIIETDAFDPVTKPGPAPKPVRKSKGKIAEGVISFMTFSLLLVGAVIGFIGSFGEGNAIIFPKLGIWAALFVLPYLAVRWMGDRDKELACIILVLYPPVPAVAFCMHYDVFGMSFTLCLLALIIRGIPLGLFSDSFANEKLFYLGIALLVGSLIATGYTTANDGFYNDSGKWHIFIAGYVVPAVVGLIIAIFAGKKSIPVFVIGGALAVFMIASTFSLQYLYGALMLAAGLITAALFFGR